MMGVIMNKRLEQEENDKVLSSKIIQNKQSGQPECYGFVEWLLWEELYKLIMTFRPHYSSVNGAKVVSDRLTGRTKGYGFVRFGDESEQLHAMTEMNGKFCSTWPMRIGPTANKKNVEKKLPQPPPPLKKGPDSKEKQGPDVPRAEEDNIFLGDGIDCAIPSKAMSQSPTSEDMEESTQNKEIVSYFNEPAYGPVPPSSDDEADLSKMDMGGRVGTGGGEQDEWSSVRIGIDDRRSKDAGLEGRLVVGQDGGRWLRMGRDGKWLSVEGVFV
ncbi:hypothetical protein RHSIM_Rhsim09G0048200 [Rhododendron simsii]|uniref:RRM domain-containing protein n=1 Tax=Rhododendron simsii TaxID=118357 RepID=A0A834GET7_RHOSS|nr:hypothetical protein RHSIM_Rhsim09G0048200 [Rhododendron simsii]